MSLSRFKTTSILFLVIGILNWLFIFIVRLFLIDKEIGNRFVGFNRVLYVSDIYFYIGLTWIIFALFYLLDDFFRKEYFTEKLKRLHFYLTLPAISVLIITPILDKYYPTETADKSGLFFQIFSTVFGLFTTVAVFAIMIGMACYLINIVKGFLAVTGLVKK